jgi:deoxycytidylate deaminase
MAQVYNSYKLDDNLKRLRKIADNSSLRNKHGACLIKGDKIYSIGYNKLVKEYFTIHAEVDALCKIDSKYTKGLDILIIRIGNTKTQKLRNSRPCNACIDKLIQRGIRRVYYSNENGDIVYELLENMQKIHVSSGYLMKCNKFEK